MNPCVSDAIACNIAALSRYRYLGLHGRKQSGKDTFFKGMEDAGHGRFHRMAFADPLKAAARAIFGGDIDAHYGDDVLRSRPLPFWSALGSNWTSYRRIHQSLGTEVFRDHVSEDLWVLSALNRILSAPLSPGTVLVFTDVRFQNEYEMVRCLGGDVLLIENVNLPPAIDSHRSETLLAGPFAAKVCNSSADGTVAAGSAWAHTMLENTVLP